MCVRDRKKPYNIMLYYVKKKKETLHFSHLWYFNFFQIVFKLFSQVLYLLCIFIYVQPSCRRISAMHWMQFTPAFLLNDCDFSLKALVAVGERKPGDDAAGSRS